MSTWSFAQNPVSSSQLLGSGRHPTWPHKLHKNKTGEMHATSLYFLIFQGSANFPARFLLAFYPSLVLVDILPFPGLYFLLDI